MSKHNRSAERRKWPTALAAIVVAVGVLLLLYVLSSGPVAMLAVRGDLSVGAYHTLYSPLAFGDENFMVEGKLLKWWREFFVTSQDWTGES